MVDGDCLEPPKKMIVFFTFNPPKRVRVAFSFMFDGQDVFIQFVAAQERVVCRLKKREG